jgi:hypothetical protein
MLNHWRIPSPLTELFTVLKLSKIPENYYLPLISVGSWEFVVASIQNHIEDVISIPETLLDHGRQP